MKKYLVLSAILLGTAVASRAGGIDFHIGIPLPPLPQIIIGHPAPVVVQVPSVCPPPPVVCAPPVIYRPPVVCAPPPVVCAPAVVVHRRPLVFHSAERAHEWIRREREAAHKYAHR
jgi:hypothetical protein